MYHMDPTRHIRYITGAEAHSPLKYIICVHEANASEPLTVTFLPTSDHVE